MPPQPIDTGNGKITLTWSVGVCEASPDDSVDQLLARADAALYSAKIGGRNRVVGAQAGVLARSTGAQQTLACASAC